jgi:glyoxylase-like metal-dependent hydrolase (beta-lactamase superfamily II)
MPVLASGLDYIDLQFLGRSHIIATVVAHGAIGAALIDPGPSTSLDTLGAALEAKGIGWADVRQILLTHIHLDHAGATGTILERHPLIEVLVHEKGAPHMVDPAKLLASAGRLYGDDMNRLWGEVKPVPRGRVRALGGGETLHVAGREMAVAYTPGHASHHVSYLDVASRVAFVGDTAGVRRGGGNYVMPPTPPPDIDIDEWQASQRRILAWDPESLFVTHFGPFGGARQHFQALFENISDWSRIVRRLLADPALAEPDREARFVDEVYRELRRRLGDVQAADYVLAGGLNYSYRGLARYWRNRA